MILACVAGAVSAVGAIATAEQFPGEGRISGLALGATTATAIFGGLTPYVAQVLTERTGWIMVPGAMIAVVAVLALPILATLPETAPSEIRGWRENDTSVRGITAPRADSHTLAFATASYSRGEAKWTGESSSNISVSRSDSRRQRGETWAETALCGGRLWGSD